MVREKAKAQSGFCNLTELLLEIVYTLLFAFMVLKCHVNVDRPMVRGHGLVYHLELFHHVGVSLVSPDVIQGDPWMVGGESELCGVCEQRPVFAHLGALL